MFTLTTVAKKRVLLALILSLLILPALPVSAANIYIDYTCVLKDALASANKDSPRQTGECEAGSGADVIILTRDDKPRSGQLPFVSEDLVIEGNNYTFNMDRREPAFRVKDAHLTIKNVKIKFEGKKRKSQAFEVTNGALTLINVVVENCEEGVEQKNSHVVIKGDSDICGLSADEIAEGSGTADITLPVPPAVDTCSGVGGGIVVTATYGTASGVQCTRVGAASAGNQAVINAGFIDAVDVWGYVAQGVEVCFPQLGGIIFLDAATSPRSVAAVSSYRQGNSACAHLTRAGTVVLTSGAAPNESRPAPAAPVTPSQPASAAGAQPISGGCPIHTTGHLVLRASPSLQAARLGYVPRGSNLVSPARSAFWYQVSYQGQTGWIGHKYVRADC